MGGRIAGRTERGWASRGIALDGRIISYSPAAPAVPRLLFRAFRGEDDLPGMAAVREGSRERDRVDPLSAREAVPTLDDLRREYADIEPGDPDMLIVEVGGEVAGYSNLLWWQEEDGTRVYLHLGWLLPAWRGRGIGTAMLRWSQGRLREVAATHPGGKRTFATNVSSTEREAAALMEGEGYVAVRRLSDMELATLDRLPEVVLPDGLDLRPVRPEHYREIYRAYKDAWAGVSVNTVESEEDYNRFLQENVEAPGFDPALWRVAWDGDRVAGLALFRIARGAGTLPELAVREGWRRRGLARALMVLGLGELRDRGVARVRLFTNASDEQGARSLYESLGFRELKRHTFYRKPMGG